MTLTAQDQLRGVFRAIHEATGRSRYARIKAISTGTISSRNRTSSAPRMTSTAMETTSFRFVPQGGDLGCKFSAICNPIYCFLRNFAFLASQLIQIGEIG